MKRHRLASPILALGIGAIAVLAAAGGSFAVSPNLAAPAVEAPTAACSTVPLDVEIILDTSGSMGSNPSGSPSHTRLYWAEAAATQLVNQLDANGGVGGASGLHHVGLTRFSDTTSTVVLALGTSPTAGPIPTRGPTGPWRRRQAVSDQPRPTWLPSRLPRTRSTPSPSAAAAAAGPTLSISAS